jgi:membrane protease YdiL (CAAX protease family)
LKDAARLLLYFVAILITGALLAPILFWTGHSIPFLAQFDFETFFHRALLVAAIALLWPLLRSTRVRSMRDLDLVPNPRWLRDLFAGFLLAAIPLLCCGAIVIALHVYSLRSNPNLGGLVKVLGATIAAPAIEETFFRGLVLGLLLRSGRKYMSIFVSSALFSIIHFLKAPGRTSTTVSWSSGFNSIAHAFAQFSDPMLVAASFTTLFVLGWILADSRIRTRSLWLPAGLHGGWILSAGVFNKVAHREMLALPWLGKNLLIGIAPLAVALLTWLLVRAWLKYDRHRQS